MVTAATTDLTSSFLLYLGPPFYIIIRHSCNSGAVCTNFW